MSKKSNGVHTISLFVANKPGVLVRCAQVFAKRGYNIDALVVSPAVNPKYSRMTITASGDPETLDQIIKQNAKLIDVVHASEHKGKDSLDREYAMVKIKCPTNSIRNKIKSAIKSKAHILNEHNKAIIIGQAGTTEELDSLEKLLKKFGIIEMVRSGKLVMAKGQKAT